MQEQFACSGWVSNEKMLRFPLKLMAEDRAVLIFIQTAFLNRWVIHVHVGTYSDAAFAGLATGDELCDVSLPEDGTVHCPARLWARTILHLKKHTHCMSC